jgi:hypothetical protein
MKGRLKDWYSIPLEQKQELLSEELDTALGAASMSWVAWLTLDEFDEHKYRSGTLMYCRTRMSCIYCAALHPANDLMTYDVCGLRAGIHVGVRVTK